MKKILKTCLLAIGIFILCQCAKEQVHIIHKAKSIVSQINFEREVDSNEGLIRFQYSASGDFSIEEIDVSGIKIEGLPKKSNVIEVLGQKIYQPPINLPNTKIPFKKDTFELNVTTKWQGENLEEISGHFLLPPSFAVESITTELSPTKPIHIKFKEKLLGTDWHDCSIDFEDAQKPGWKKTLGPVVSNYSSTSVTTFPFQEIDIDFVRFQEVESKHLSKVPSELQITFSCNKSFRVPGPSINDLYYKLKSQPFVINVQRP